ncbi:hypothetical protein TNCV_5029551 [Trichonephila clavipes]|nr:hypothetical protein TNCV_5029551 [Trichonephila clavipes]
MKVKELIEPRSRIRDAVTQGRSRRRKGDEGEKTNKKESKDIGTELILALLSLYGSFVQIYPVLLQEKIPRQKLSQTAMKNNTWKRWNTTENDTSKNQPFTDTAIRLPNTSILTTSIEDKT